MREGLVLWGVRNIYYVQDFKTGNEFKCVLKGKVLSTDFNVKGRREVNPVVVGDVVGFDKVDETNGLITERKKRRNEFKRLKRGGRYVQTIFANIDYLVVIDSIYHPTVRSYFIDRCLFTAEYMGVPAVIVFNKYDLLDDKINEEYSKIRDTYKKLGYIIIETSAETGEGVKELTDLLRGKIASFNGRSGVGKSSLIAAIDPAYADIKVGEINRKYDKGNHTTTFARIYPLQCGAKLIDTPGIRELAIYIDKKDDVEHYIRDFYEYRDECRFMNCQHINEPGCRVLEALENNEIEHFRYNSYIKMRNTIEMIKDSKI